MVDVKHRPALQVIDGVLFPAMFPEENVRSAIRYKPSPDDVFIVSYPKCGVTWSQHMLILLFRKGVPMTSGMEYFTISPFLEATGADAVRDMPRPGIIKVHLPFHLTPYSPKAKYIYIARNPKDCCVSYFYHTIGIGAYQFEGSFDEYFELFMTGDIDYGDYFDHLLEWYKKRNDPNVLFVTYEEMKADVKAAAFKFASFLGEEYVDLLKENPDILENVIHFSSFDYMKEKVNVSFDEIQETNAEGAQNEVNVPESMKPLILKMREMGKLMEGKRPTHNFVRKGVVGDWRNHFSPEQNKRMNEKISQKLKGTEFMDLWKDYM